MKLSSVMTALPMLGLMWPAHGHHSDSGYDRESVVVLDAEVTRYVFRNPHVTIFVEAEDANGDMVEWEIETGSTPIMLRSGWSRDLLSPGDPVVVRAHPERSGRPIAILNTLETADGNLWSQIEREAEATASATSLEGVWKGIAATSLAGQVRRQAEPTQAGLEAQQEWDPLVDDPNLQCIPNPPPFHVSSNNYLTGIEILDDRVTIRNEFFDVVRTIYTNGRGHPEDAEHTNQGHSIGWWEDDVLVVETALLAEHRDGNGAGIPSSTQRRVVERFSLSEDGRRAIVDVTFEDPVYLAEPFNGRTEMAYVPHLRLYRYDCAPQQQHQ